MFKKIAYFIVIAVIISVIASCSKYNKLLKSTDLNEKAVAAEAYYLKEDYYRSQQLFEDLITYYRGTANAEKMYYYYAYSYYGLGDYTSAAYYFKSFALSYPKSKFARETQFMSAYCTYLNSSDYSLDQTSTLTAIKELQLFADMYPKSDSVALCNTYIDDLRLKLETKEFEVSKLYYKMEEYKAAVVSFKNTIKDYPDTKYKEDCLFYIMKAYYLFANNSIVSKKAERYQQAITAYETLLADFPQTKYLKEAESINKNAAKELNKYKITKST